MEHTAVFKPFYSLLYMLVVHYLSILDVFVPSFLKCALISI